MVMSSPPREFSGPLVADRPQIFNGGMGDEAALGLSKDLRIVVETAGST
jgi:hypothetical protein